MRILILSLILLFLTPVYAKPQPTLIWEYDAGWTVGAVDISPDGEYIAVASENYVHLLNKSEDLLWNASFDSKVLSVVVSPDGEVIVGDEYSLYFYNKSGNETWSRYIGDDVEDISLYNGKIAVGSKTRRVYLFDKEGNILWSYDTNFTVRGVVVYNDGVAAGTSYGNIYFFNMTGGVVWKYESNKFIRDIALQGKTIVVGMNDLYFIKDGKFIGYYITDGDVTGLDATDNYIVASSDKGAVYFLDKDRKHVSTYNVTKPLEAALTSNGSHVVVASMENVLFLAAPDLVPPLVKIINPTNGAMVTGVVKVMAEVSESAKIRVLIDNNYACGALPCSWDTGASYDGKHVIVVEATDASGNTGQNTVAVVVRKTIIQNVTGVIKEGKESIEESLNKTIPTLPLIKKTREDYSIIKKIIIIIAILVILVAVIKMRAGGRKYRYKKW